MTAKEPTKPTGRKPEPPPAPPPKVYDGLAALANVAGLKREEVDAIWKDVKANNARLEACEGPHDFVKEGEGLRAKWRCSKCSGEVGARERRWYDEGRKHGEAMWREALEWALGLEGDAENHSAAWAKELVREIREVGNRQ